MFEIDEEKISSYILDKQDFDFQCEEINKIVNTLNKSKNNESSNIKPKEHLNKIAVLSDTHGSLISLIGSLLDAGIITELKQPEFVYDLLNNKYIDIKDFKEITDGDAKLYYNEDTSKLTKDKQNYHQNPLSRFIVIPGFKINEDYKGQVIHLGNILDRGRENYHSLLFLKKLKQELIKLDNSNNNKKDNPDNNKKDNPKYSDKLILLCGNHEISNRVSNDILRRLVLYDDIPYIYARDNIVKDMVNRKEMNLIYDYKTKTDNNDRVIFSHIFDANTMQFDNENNIIEKFIEDIKYLINSVSKSKSLDKYKPNKKKSIMASLSSLLEESKLFSKDYCDKKIELELLGNLYGKIRYRKNKDKYKDELIELYKKYYELNFRLLQTLDLSIAFKRKNVKTPFDYRNMSGLPSGSSFLNIVGHEPNSCFEYKKNNLIYVNVGRNTNYCNNNKKYEGKISTLYLDDNIINEIIEHKKKEEYKDIDNLLSKNSNTIDYTVERDKTNNKYNEILVNDNASKKIIYNENIQQPSKKIDNTDNKDNQVIMNNSSAFTFSENDFEKPSNEKECVKVVENSDIKNNQAKNINTNSETDYIDIKQNLIKISPVTNNSMKKTINKPIIQSYNKDNKSIMNDPSTFSFADNNKKEGNKVDAIIIRQSQLPDKSNQKSSKPKIDFKNKKIQKESKSYKIDNTKNNNLNTIYTNKKLISNRSKVLYNNQYNSNYKIQPCIKEDNRIHISNNKQKKLPEVSSRSNMNQPITITKTNIEPKNKNNINKPIVKHDRPHYMEPTVSSENRNEITREFLNKRQQKNNQNKLQRILFK